MSEVLPCGLAKCVKTSRMLADGHLLSSDPGGFLFDGSDLPMTSLDIFSAESLEEHFLLTVLRQRRWCRVMRLGSLSLYLDAPMACTPKTVGRHRKQGAYTFYRPVCHNRRCQQRRSRRWKQSRMRPFLSQPAAVILDRTTPLALLTIVFANTPMIEVLTIGTYADKSSQPWPAEFGAMMTHDASKLWCSFMMARTWARVIPSWM